MTRRLLGATESYWQEAWMSDAACKPEDHDLFFPESTTGPGTYARARRICARCPVRDECAEYAITHAMTAGLWGSMTPAERKQERRRRRVA